VLTTRPIDLANFKNATVAEQAQAKLLTALALSAREGIAVGGSGSPCAEAEYAARLVCMVGGLKSMLTSGAANSVAFAPQAGYLLAAYEKLNRGLATVQGGQSPSALGLNVETIAEKALVEAVEAKAILFGYDASASPLANTKALFADLRTHIVRLSDGEDVFGIAPMAEALQEDYQSNVAPVLSSTNAVLVAAYTAAELIEAAEPGTYEDGSGHVICGYDPGPLQTGADGAVCRYGREWDEQILIKISRSAPGTYAITTRPLEFVEVPYDPSAALNEIYYPWPGGKFEVVEATDALAATFSITRAGAGAMSASWKGPYYVTPAGGRVTGDLSAAQSEDWNPATISGTLTVGGALSDGAGGIALEEARIGEGSRIFVRNAALAEGDRAEISGSLSVTRLATDAFVYAVKATIEEPVLDRSGRFGVPASIGIVGSIGQVGAGGVTTPLFNGEIELATQGVASFDASQPAGPANSFVVQAKVIGTLALPNARVLSVSAAANASQIDPTPETPHSLSVTYAYTTPQGIARIHISGKYDETSGYSATVTTNSGVTAELTRKIEGKVQGTVTAKGVATATIVDTTINYSDGSTESVF
jgi:hypothetical protein